MNTQTKQNNAARDAGQIETPDGKFSTVAEADQALAARRVIENVALWESKHVDPELALRFVGWMDSDAEREVKGGVKRSVGESISAFVKANLTEVKELKNRNTKY